MLFVFDKGGDSDLIVIIPVLVQNLDFSTKYLSPKKLPDMIINPEN